MELRATVDLRELSKVTARGKAIARITAESLNRIAEKGRATVVDTTLKQLNLKRRYVFGMFRLVRASAMATVQEAQIRGTRKSVGLRNFDAKQVWRKVAGRKRRPWGVQVQISPSAAPERIRSAFFAKLKQGGMAVFRREETSKNKFVGRYPIEVLKSAQPSQIFLRIAPVVSLELMGQLRRDIEARAARFLRAGIA